ncbi:MAG: glycosyltransferase N-terminal domain-containing protein [Gemmatimonadota bacterium]
MHPALRVPYAAAGTIAEWAAARASQGGGKIMESLAGRHGVVDRFVAWGAAHRDPSRPLVWLHAPSVGEGLQARPVLELLRTRRPDVQLVYTHYSSSARAFASGAGADFSDFLPFDTRRATRAVLRAIRPSALVFSKLDVWPVLVDEAVRQGVGVALIAATLAEHSGRQGPLGRALLRDAYRALRVVGAIDAADAMRLQELGVRADRIQVTGDTRYDQVWARAHAIDRRSGLIAALAGTRPTLVAGSTWPSDERVLEDAWRAVREQSPNARLIIAPHEPDESHLGPIEEWIAREGWRGARLGTAAASDADVVVVDRVGVLGDLYALADVAYVGGGFHAAGLHSVLEPAAFGAPVLFGPRFASSRDAGLLIASEAGRSTENAGVLAGALLAWLNDDDARARWWKAAWERPNDRWRWWPGCSDSAGCRPPGFRPRGDATTLRREPLLAKPLGRPGDAQANAVARAEVVASSNDRRHAHRHLLGHLQAESKVEVDVEFRVGRAGLAVIAPVE